MTQALGCLDAMPRVPLAHVPTPIDAMPNLAAYAGAANLYAKRDDCTGLCMGGNKARQLEFYFGAARAEGADTVLITGAVQSNYVRMAAAAARKLGMDCHIQLEERVANPADAYRQSGNVLLDRLLGATLHSFPEGENEAGADRNLERIAGELATNGAKPFIIHLGPGHPPLGALGYVVAAGETLRQLDDAGLRIDEVVVPSGSGATHAGLLFGLRALGCSIPVRGICVRRAKDLQRGRIADQCRAIATLLQTDNPVSDADVDLNDDVLAPGYGMVNDAVLQAIALAARHEGLIVDPVYSARAMAGFLDRARAAESGQNLLFLHTGGQPAVFGYAADLAPLWDGEGA